SPAREVIATRYWPSVLSQEPFRFCCATSHSRPRSMAFVVSPGGRGPAAGNRTSAATSVIIGRPPPRTQGGVRQERRMRCGETTPLGAVPATVVWLCDKTCRHNANHLSRTGLYKPDAPARAA